MYNISSQERQGHNILRWRDGGGLCRALFPEEDSGGIEGATGA